MFRGVLACRAGAGRGGSSARGDEPEGGGYRIPVRLFGVGRIAAPRIGAVPGRASREG